MKLYMVSIYHHLATLELSEGVAIYRQELNTTRQRGESFS